MVGELLALKRTSTAARSLTTTDASVSPGSSGYESSGPASEGSASQPRGNLLESDSAHGCGLLQAYFEFASSAVHAQESYVSAPQLVTVRVAMSQVSASPALRSYSQYVAEAARDR